MARLLVFNALISSERASVTAASTVSDGMPAHLFHRRKGVLHQPTGQHSEWQSVVCWQKTWCLSKSAVNRVYGHLITRQLITRQLITDT